jgi:hypothetical protein
MLMEMMKKAKISNHSNLPPSASRRVSPSAWLSATPCLPCLPGLDDRTGDEGSLSNKNSKGTATNKTAPPEIAYALRQPNQSSSLCVAGGQMTPPRAVPHIASPSASPRRSVNHREIRLACGTAEVPGPTRPSRRKTAYRCHKFGVRNDKEAYNAPNTAMHNRIGRRAPNRSVNHPVNGMVSIAVSVASVNANETCPRDHRNSSQSVVRKTPNALTSNDPK